MSEQTSFCALKTSKSRASSVLERKIETKDQEIDRLNAYQIMFHETSNILDMTQRQNQSTEIERDEYAKINEDLMKEQDKLKFDLENAELKNSLNELKISE